MSTDIAPPALLRASALAADHDAPWLAEGFHLRVRVNPWLGFPLHPFAAWRLVAGEPERLPIVWTDVHGKALTVPFDVEQIDGPAEGLLFGVTRWDPYIWAEVRAQDQDLRIDLLDAHRTAGGADRVLATRRTPGPFRFGHTGIVRLRATGAGTIHETVGIPLSNVATDDFAEQPNLVFGLPLDLPPHWYAPDPNADPRNTARKRVELGVPPRLSPPDNPDGTVPGGTDQAEETDRIMDRIGPEFVDPWLIAGWGDPGTAPVDASFGSTLTTPEGRSGVATAPVAPSLLTMAVDPQIARYLGLATIIESGSTAPAEDYNIWLIAARWAIQRNRVLQAPAIPFGSPLTLGGILGAAPTTDSLDSYLDHAFPGAQDIIADLPSRPGGGSGPWSCQMLWTVAVAAGDAVPDPPDPFPATADPPGAWNPQADPEYPGPETWRQTIALGASPAPGMVGFARTSPGTTVPLHRFEPPPGQGYVSRAMPLVPNWAGNNRRVVEDPTVPVDAGSATWRVWSGDEFGQWSAGFDLPTTPMPARPAPPPPLLEATFTAAPADGTSGARVPGTLRLRCTVPSPGHTAPGSAPITELRLKVDGVVLPPQPVAPDQTLVIKAKPTAFAVGEQRPVPVVAWFVDETSTLSEAPTTLVLAHDARAPQALPTSPEVLWTGQSDATGQAQLELRWPSRPGAARYRVYLGDARRLAGSLPLALPQNPVRAAQAKPLHTAAKNLKSKSAFTFIGEADGKAGSDGLIHFATRIPGGLRSVQFVRIVPLSSGGAETPFATCGLVPIAVPSNNRPPPPLLDAVTDPADGLTLTIRALGLRPELLAAAAGRAPEFRVRRTRKGTDPQYAPLWASGKLTGPDTAGVWSVQVTVPVARLDPFIRSVWYAEVRYPAEPPLPPGTVPEPVDDTVEPAWGSIGDEAEGLWGESSLPAESLLVPPAPPSAPAAPVVTTAADGSVTLALSGLPTAHPAAGTPYRLEIYRGTPGTAPQERAVIPVSAPAPSWTDPAPVPAGSHYDLVVVDPLGRRSLATRAS
ncbi:hypothetical protein AB0C98_41945 [Streptomyces sp. NPDC048558]|uniref:hypothetical protein n=1 Tax=Streptomyces sp. NPDC048558 TaxID=3155759 RepID=UPI003440C804